MNTQKARNTAAGMVYDALEQILHCKQVQDMLNYSCGEEDELIHRLTLAQDALDYFEQHYDYFPQAEPPRECWAVVTADPQSDEPGYLAYTSLYAKREDALKALRNSAAEDAETIDGEIKWHNEDSDEPWCQVCYYDGEVRWTYMLERKAINGSEVAK